VVITTPNANRIRARMKTVAPGRRELRIVASDMLVAKLIAVDGLHGYFFELRDSADAYAVRATEYFVDGLVAHAGAAGLDVVHMENLHTFAARHASTSPLALQMNIGDLTPAEQSVMELYDIVVLQKRPEIRAPQTVTFGAVGAPTQPTVSAFMEDDDSETYDF
jgi:hypothetical protein